MPLIIKGGVHSGEVLEYDELTPVRLREIEASGGHIRRAPAHAAEAFDAELEKNTDAEVEKVVLEERSNAYEAVDAPGAPDYAQVDQSRVDEAQEEAAASAAPLPEDADVHVMPTTEERNEPAEPVSKDEFNREELNELAAKRGVEGAEKMANKAEVVEAINATIQAGPADDSAGADAEEVGKDADALEESSEDLQPLSDEEIEEDQEAAAPADDDEDETPAGREIDSDGA